MKPLATLYTIDMSVPFTPPMEPAALWKKPVAAAPGFAIRTLTDEPCDANDESKVIIGSINVLLVRTVAAVDADCEIIV